MLIILKIIYKEYNKNLVFILKKFSYLKVWKKLELLSF